MNAKKRSDIIGNMMVVMGIYCIGFIIFVLIWQNDDETNYDTYKVFGMIALGCVIICLPLSLTKKYWDISNENYKCHHYDRRDWSRRDSI